MTETALLVLSVAAAAHLGFQLTVTLLVYPALARVDEVHWASAHQRHSTAIIPLVAVVYGGLALASGWALVAAPADPAVVTAVSAAGATILLTATIAGPTHGQLGRQGPRHRLLQRLRRVDRLRVLTAGVCAAAACWAAWR